MSGDSAPEPDSESLIALALELRADVDRFESRWTPLAASEACPTFSWRQLERQLVDLAPSDLQAELVHRLVERTRMYAQFKPAEMVLREILCIAALVLDEASPEPQPQPQPRST